MEDENKPKMKTAREVFASQARKGTDPGNVAFYSALRMHGSMGLLGEYLFLAHRSHVKLKELYNREVIDPDYERKLRGLNNFNIDRLKDHCVLRHDQMPTVIFKQFKYGYRITVQNEAVIRFRQRKIRRSEMRYWTGDDANFDPIMNYCDRLAQA